MIFCALRVQSQCNPACSLTVVNEIDCDVELEIQTTCGNVLYTPPQGNSSNPSTTNPLSAAIYCNCTVTAVIVKTINGVTPTGGPVTLLSTTTNINVLGTCCSLNYGTFRGCDIHLWMSCP